MRLGPFIWTSFRDLATPEETADIMVELFGGDAMLAATQAAAGARADDREEDAEFWDDARAALDQGRTV